MCAKKTFQLEPPVRFVAADRATGESTRIVNVTLTTVESDNHTSAGYETMQSRRASKIAQRHLLNALDGKWERLIGIGSRIESICMSIWAYLQALSAC